MTPPPSYGPPTAAPGSDKVLLWGVLGVVLAVCCAPVGIIFGGQSVPEARKAGKRPALGSTAVGLGALLTIVNLIAIASGAYSGITVR